MAATPHWPFEYLPVNHTESSKPKKMNIQDSPVSVLACVKLVNFTSIHSFIHLYFWKDHSLCICETWQSMYHFWNRQQFVNILIYIQSTVVIVLNMWDFLCLSRLFDAVKPLNDSCISFHSRDAIWDTLPSLLFLILISIWQSIIGGPPWLVAVRGYHWGWSEIQTDDIWVGSCKVLWTNCLQLFWVKATVVKKAFHVSSSPSIPVWQVWFRSV